MLLAFPMKILPGFAALALLLTSAAFARGATPGLFDYDRSSPPGLREVGRETRGDALVRDVTFRSDDATIAAYLVAPSAGAHDAAGILYVHWLGEPATTNRTEFLNEAVALAGQGVVSVLVDAMWAETDWYARRVPEEDYARSIRQVVALRRAMDLLLAQPGIDPARIAYVGHDFGAMYGTLLGGADRRAKTYVLMAGIPHLADWFFYAKQPKDPAAYRAQLAPLDPVNVIPQIAPASVFFQFAATDEYVSAKQAAEFYAAAAPRKQMTTYQAHHDLHTPEVAADRIAWLMRELRLQ